jgi:hypothetical protein
MKRLIILSGLVLSGCASDTTRTLPVLVWEDRPLNEVVGAPREPLKIPSDYKDPVLADWNKNNFNSPVKSVPLPPPRPKQ